MSPVYSKRWFAYSYLSLFLLSCIFPVAASLITIDTPPLWVGIVDVVLAFLLVFAGFLLFVSTQKIDIAVEKKVLSIILSVSSLPMFLLLLFFTDVFVIRWDILLPGLAWRYWLFLMVVTPLVKIFKVHDSRP
jgi:hypothetical protein